MFYRYLLVFGLVFFSYQSSAQENNTAAGEQQINAIAAAPVMTEAGNEEFFRMLQHASPMPNLMMIALKNREELALDEIQVRNLEFWRDHKSIIAKRLVKEIMALESDINKATLDGKPTGYLINQISTMLSLRMKLASQKVLCRDNMMHVLTPEQWSKVVSLYKG